MPSRIGGYGETTQDPAHRSREPFVEGGLEAVEDPVPPVVVEHVLPAGLGEGASRLGFGVDEPEGDDQFLGGPEGQSGAGPLAVPRHDVAPFVRQHERAREPRLHHRPREALEGRRLDVGGRGGEGAVALVGGQEPEVDDAVGDVGRRVDLAGPDRHQPQVDAVTPHGGGERVEQPLPILGPLPPSGVEHERALDAVAVPEALRIVSPRARAHRCRGRRAGTAGRTGCGRDRAPARRGTTPPEPRRRAAGTVEGGLGLVVEARHEQRPSTARSGRRRTSSRTGTARRRWRGSRRRGRRRWCHSSGTRRSSFIHRSWSSIGIGSPRRMAAWRLARSARGVSSTVGNRTTRSLPTSSTPAGYSLAQVKWSRAHVVRMSTSHPRSASPSAVSRSAASAPPITLVAEPRRYEAEATPATHSGRK